MKDPKETNTPSILNVLRPRNIVQARNRGLLLDVFVFAANLLIMGELSRRFFSIVKKTSAGDPDAAVILFLFFLALSFLAPAGAVLKRYHFHRQLKVEGKEPADAVAGCLFHPIFYFCVSITIFAAANAFLMEYIHSGSDLEAHIFLPSIFVGLALVILNTFLVYRYFTPPRKEPRTEFMRSRRSAIAGDVCIFVNMLFFQILFNAIFSSPFPAPTSAADLAGRFFFIGFIALLLYFPPRIFYLAGDIDKGRTWLFILLANSPALIRIIFGGGIELSW